MRPLAKIFKNIESFRFVTAAATLMIGAFWLIFKLSPESLGASCGDFYSFWAAAKVLLKGLNPYDLQQISPLLGQDNFSCSSLLPIYNPPSIFFFLLPLALFDSVSAPKIWLSLSLLLFVGTFVSQTIKSGKYLLSLSLVFFSFLPFLLHIYLGQLTIINLICVTSALFCLKKEHYALAGLLSGLTMWKPNVCYLLIFALLVESLRNKRFSFLIGFFFSTILLFSAPIFFRHSIYFDFLSAEHIHPLQWLTPTLGSWLGILLSSNTYALHLLPSLLAIFVVGAWIFVRKKTSLTEIELNFLIIIGIITTPYAWTYDFIMLLLPIAVLVRTTPYLATSVSLLVLMNFILWSQIGLMHFHAWYPIALLILFYSFPKTLVNQNS